MLLDNKSNGKVGDKLKEILRPDAKLSVISGLVSIYAFEALKQELDKIDGARILSVRMGDCNR